MAKLIAFWCLVSLLTQVLSIPTIYIDGIKFIREDEGKKTQFYIKGVVYQPEGSSKLTDPLANKAQCDIDIPLMKELGVNTVTVYFVNATLSHDACMNAFAEAGIYILLSLPNPVMSLNRNTPDWNIDLYESYTAVIDAFAGYDNILGFYAGNEVVNSGASLKAAPAVKAVIQDMKNYIASRRHRQIPVGYGQQDDVETRLNLSEYLACASTNATVDFISYNVYSWCGQSSFRLSGYDTFLKDMDSHRLPVFFGETGCNTVTRTFSDQAAVLGPDMNGRLSGAIIYEWTMEANKYGLVSYAGGSASPTVVPIVPDFRNLKSQWATLNPDGTQTTWLSPLDAREQVACPTSTSGTTAWNVDASASLPTLGVRVFANRPVVTPPISKSSSIPTVLPTLTNPNGAAKTDAQGNGFAQNNSTGALGDKTKDPSTPAAKKGSGTTIGIGVGVGIAALALLAFLVWFIMRRRKAKKLILNPFEPAGLEVSGVDTFQPKPELDGFSAGVVGIPVRKRTQNTIVEMGANETVVAPAVVELANGNEVLVGAIGRVGRKRVVSEQNVEQKNGSPTVNSANTPWMDEGREEFSRNQPAAQDLRGEERGFSAATALAHAQAQSSDRVEIERLEEEERRLDREIVESERLRNLQIERARVRTLLEEKRRGGGGGV